MASDAVSLQPALGVKNTLQAVDANHSEPVTIVGPDKDPPEDAKTTKTQLVQNSPGANSKTQISTQANQGAKGDGSPLDGKSEMNKPKMTALPRTGQFEPEDENTAESATATRSDSTANFVIEIEIDDGTKASNS